jgi:hypothetical protein
MPDFHARPFTDNPFDVPFTPQEARATLLGAVAMIPDCEIVEAWAGARLTLLHFMLAPNAPRMPDHRSRTAYGTPIDRNDAKEDDGA